MAEWLRRLIRNQLGYTRGSSNLSVVVYGCVAEWSKALDLGSNLFGGVGSNPTAINVT